VTDAARELAFREAGGTWGAVARVAGVNRTSVRDAVLGHTKRPALAIAEAVAAVIGRPVEEVFPLLSGRVRLAALEAAKGGGDRVLVGMP
jgi:DNA-binding XRE family transcriptional regulator